MLENTQEWYFLRCISDLDKVNAEQKLSIVSNNAKSKQNVCKVSSNDIEFLLVQRSRKRHPHGKKDRFQVVRDSIIPRRFLVGRRKHRVALSDPVRGFSCKNNRVTFLIRVRFKPLRRALRSIFVSLDTSLFSLQFLFLYPTDFSFSLVFLLSRFDPISPTLFRFADFLCETKRADAHGATDLSYLTLYAPDIGAIWLLYLRSSRGLTFKRKESSRIKR